jgi:hypothetical protein
VLHLNEGRGPHSSLSTGRPAFQFTRTAAGLRGSRFADRLGPLAGGWLSGRYRKDAEVTGPMPYTRQRLANRFDMSMPETRERSRRVPGSPAGFQKDIPASSPFMPDLPVHASRRRSRQAARPVSTTA